jgi:iron complex transport system substrate-binding protein
LPELGSITGRGATVAAAALRRAVPDLILDVGTIDPAYAALGNRIARESGAAYALMDGRLAQTPATLRPLGAVLGVADRAESLAQYTEGMIARLERGVPAVLESARPRVYFTRSADGLTGTVAVPSMARSSIWLGRAMSSPRQAREPSVLYRSINSRVSRPMRL